MSDTLAPPVNIDVDEGEIEEEALASLSSQSSLHKSKYN